MFVLKLLLGVVLLYVLIMLGFYLQRVNEKGYIMSFRKFIQEVGYDLTHHEGTVIPIIGVHLLVVLFTAGYVSVFFALM